MSKFSLAKIYFTFVSLIIIISFFDKHSDNSVNVISLPGLKAKEYKIHEIKVEDQKFAFKVEIPYRTDLKVSLLDTNGAVIRNMIDEKNFPLGVYMIKCSLNEVPKGKYICSMETKDFIYETEFIF